MIIFVRPCRNQTSIITKGAETTRVKSGELETGDGTTDRMQDTKMKEEHMIGRVNHRAINTEMLTHTGTPVYTKTTDVIIRQRK